MDASKIEMITEAVFTKANTSILNRVEARSGTEEDINAVRKAVAKKLVDATK